MHTHVDAMNAAPHTPTRQVLATVQEVLPGIGLAYVGDDRQGQWAVTRSTRSTCGDGLQALHPGQRVALTVVDHPRYSLAVAYATLD